LPGSAPDLRTAAETPTLIRPSEDAEPAPTKSAAPARRSLGAVGPARPSGKAEGERAPARRGLSSPAGGAPSRSTAPAAKGNSKLFIILGGAAVVLIAVVAWVALGGKKKEPPMELVKTPPVAV